MILFKVLLFLTVVEIKPIEPALRIDMSPAELQSIGEVLVESYLRHNLIKKKVTTPRLILSKVFSFFAGVLQMLSVTLSLIAANIFTPFFTLPPQINVNNQMNGSKQCPNDFGCDHNVCWRTCTHVNNGTKLDSWCYTSPTPHYRKHAHCSSPMDCSPCWSCIGICHTPRK